MPKVDPEPENYSVEEMMERLREGEREKEANSSGELVTRADGTQAVRVRKRKRRTEQPEKKSAVAEKKRRPIVWLVGVALFLILGLGVAVVVLLGRYNSSGFRSGLEEHIDARSGGTAVFEGLVVTPVAARARSLELSWKEGRSLRSLSLSGLGTELSLGSFLSGDWREGVVVAESAELLLLGTENPGGGASAAAEPLPFSELRCDFANVSLGAKNQGGRFKNVDFSLREGPDGESQLLWNGGDAKLRGWGPMVVDRGMAEVMEGGVKLVSLRMRPKEGTGEVTFSGRKLLRDGEDVELAVVMESFPLQTVLGDSLGNVLAADITAEDGSLVLEGASLTESEFRLAFAGTSAVLKDLPFLHILHTRLGDTEFIRPEFREVSGVFVRDHKGMRLQDLELSAPYQMVVRGHLEVDAEGQLSGRLEVGVVEGKIMTPTNRKRSTVFSDPREGYCWVTINLGGTVEKPIDDLQGLLQKAAHEAAARDRDSRLQGPGRDRE